MVLGALRGRGMPLSRGRLVRFDWRAMSPVFCPNTVALHARRRDDEDVAASNNYSAIFYDDVIVFDG